ncbi:MAG: helix-turn-helix transcriptional regulator [Clostridia bacterium]|nr:helix-turn-helix transcriptional regulator [Clostridia bacterium]
MIVLKNECYRLFREYCKLSVDDTAELTGISKERLLLIEHGEIIPTDDECKKFSKLYNISSDKLNGSIREVFETIVREPMDASFYDNYVEKDVIVERVTSLSVFERLLIMKLRLSENQQELNEKIMQMLSE